MSLAHIRAQDIRTKAIHLSPAPSCSWAVGWRAWVLWVGENVKNHNCRLARNKWRDAGAQNLRKPLRPETP